MGLRETKAARTREQILDVALPLFLARGFDDVTMEEIAERSEVGTSTVYRYFPSKDLILLDRFRETGVIATRLRERPVDEPLEQALAHAISATLDAVSADDRRMLAVRDVIDRTPGPRARLWDLVAQDRELLQDAVAERTGCERVDVSVALTARLALLIYELAADTWRTSDPGRGCGDHHRPAHRQRHHDPPAPTRPLTRRARNGNTVKPSPQLTKTDYSGLTAGAVLISSPETDRRCARPARVHRCR